MRQAGTQYGNPVVFSPARECDHNHNSLHCGQIRCRLLARRLESHGGNMHKQPVAVVRGSAPNPTALCAWAAPTDRIFYRATVTSRAGPPPAVARHVFPNNFVTRQPASRKREITDLRSLDVDLSIEYRVSRREGRGRQRLRTTRVKTGTSVVLRVLQRRLQPCVWYAHGGAHRK